MSRIRLISRLDIKGQNLIKGVNLEGLRIIGDPQEYSYKYYTQGIDEIIYMDVVASLYGRNSLHEFVKKTVYDIFVPLTVGGGLRSVVDVKEMLRSGADKVAINTAATKRPKLISEVAEEFGSQCMVLSIEAKRQSNYWEVFTDNGREKTNLNVVEWAQLGVELGAGEILLTSVDQEGTRQGFDYELVKAVSSAVSVPVVASGGMGNPQHLIDVVQYGYANAIAMADILHYDRVSLAEIRKASLDAGLDIRRV